VNDHENEFNIFKLKFEGDFEGYIGTFSYSDKLINTLFTSEQLNESVEIDMNDLYEQYP